MNHRESSNPVRYAVVAAGWFGQAAVLPAFANAKENSKLVAIVSSDAEKRALLSQEYGVEAVPLEAYETLLKSDEIDAVYLVSPNTLHRPQTLLAAKHGVHVLCEKPLAESATSAEKMILACEKANVHLMTAYRLHFEKANLRAIEAIREGQIGEPRIITTTFTQQVDADNSRLDASLGGHPLLDVGIYCINAARYLLRSEPIEVTAFEASRDEEKFKDVPEMVSAILRFPNERIVNMVCGFGEAKTSVFEVIGTKGTLRMESAYSHQGERTMTLTIDGHSKSATFPETDQVAAEIVYFSDCILNNRNPEPSGREGLIDLRIIDAIRSSCLKGKSVPLQPMKKNVRPSRDQHISKPKREEPELVNAAPPQA